MYNVFDIFEVYQIAHGGKMRKKVVIAGLILLIVGIAIIVAGGFASLGISKKGNTINNIKPGEYATPEFIFNGSYTLTISGAPSDSALIYSSNYSVVNATNFNKYAIKPVNTINGVLTYSISSGSYYFVIFSLSTPHITYTEIPVGASLYLFGIIGIVGIALFIGGIITAIAGLILKKTNRIQNNRRGV